MLAQSAAADQAHLRSHSGPGASEVLCCAPTKPEFQMQPDVFRTVILERLRLPLDMRRVRGQPWPSPSCIAPGHGRLRSGAVVRRGHLPECVEKKGQWYTENVKLRDMNTTMPVNDAREIEVVASGLPLFHGAQIAVDVTLRSQCLGAEHARMLQL